MARILVIGGLGWDVPIWLDRPFFSGARILARTLPAKNGPRPSEAGLPGRLGGGAANIAAALMQAGHEVWVLGRIGKDAQGALILDKLARRGIGTEYVVEDDAPTTSAQVLIEPNGERTLIGFSSVSRMVSGEVRAHWHKAYNPPDELANMQFDALIQRAPWPVLPVRPNLSIAHMPSRANLDADVVVGGLADLSPSAWEGPLDCARQTSPSASWGIVTDGANGLVGQSEDERFCLRVDPVSAIDTTGAGDVFLAGLCDGLLAGASMQAACAHGANWGGLCVATEGSAVEPEDKRFPAFIHEPGAL